MSYLGYPYKIKQASPVIDVEFDGDYIKVPEGTTTQRDNNIPIPQSGMMRFNSTEEMFEGYDGIEWGTIGGGTNIDIVDSNNTDVKLSLTALPVYDANGNYNPIMVYERKKISFLYNGSSNIYLEI